MMETLKGQHQTAIADYTRSIQLYGNNDALAYTNRGFAYHNLGQYQNAINDATKAIQLDPDHVYAYLIRGISYHNQPPRQYATAIDDHTNAIQLDPGYANAYNNRSIAYRALGQPTLADADKTMACSLDSKYC